MRTLSEMRTRVRRWLNDVDSNQWDDDTEIDNALRSAHEFTISEIVSSPSANFYLRRSSAPIQVQTRMADYRLPSDCLAALGAEFRSLTTKHATLTCGTAGETDSAVWAAISDGSFHAYLDGREYRVTGIDFSGVASMAAVAAAIQTALRAVTGGTETVEWSTDHFIVQCYDSIGYLVASEAPAGTDIGAAGYMNGRSGGGTVSVSHSRQAWSRIPEESDAPTLRGPQSATSALYATASGPFACWRRSGAGGYATFSPLPATSNGLVRFDYLFEPGFPGSASETFHFLPSGYDTCVEYFAAAHLAGEEIEDDVPVGAYGSLWRSTLSNMVGGRLARRVRSARRTIRRVR